LILPELELLLYDVKAVEKLFLSFHLLLGRDLVREGDLALVGALEDRN
jgi:hypothetical protein